MSSPIVILVVGSTVATVRARRGDFADWFAHGLGRTLTETNGEAPDAVLFNPRDDSASEPDLRASSPPPAGVVVTGSASMVTEEDAWSLRAERWLARALEHDVPVLGVCYGHQLLARVAGGTVDWNPLGREIGTVEVELTAGAAEDPLFADLAARFSGQASHSQSVTVLPPRSTLLARSARDPHAAFRLEGKRAWGVQFHPEFDADITRGYLQERRDELAAEGLDPEALSAAAHDDDAGARLLRRFDALCRMWAAVDARPAR